MKSQLFIIIEIILFAACVPISDYKLAEEFFDYNIKKIPYQLNNPDTTFSLHWDLEETSALAYYKNDLLLTVEDERGKVYFINATTGKVVRTIKFAKGGDYEGIEVIGDTIWVMKSNGDFFYFSSSEKDVKVKEYSSPFKSDNDLEGLGKLGNKLLVACKGEGSIEHIDQEGKGIYILDKKSIQPYLFIQKDQLKSFIKDRQYFNKIKDFDPSGIAVHPLNGDIYVLSADKVLAVYDKALNLKEVAKLSRSIYYQPEGICFAPDGTLYISSEGDGDKGELIKMKIVSTNK